MSPSHSKYDDDDDNDYCLETAQLLVSYRVRNISTCINKLLQSKGKAVPLQGMEWTRGFQEVKVPRFHDNGRGRW